MGADPEKAPNPKLSREVMVDLYAAARYLGVAAEKAAGLRMPVPVYFKDPLVAKQFADVAIDKAFTTLWEPGLRDGPTSARFAIVDYDATQNVLTPPARWDRAKNTFLTPAGAPLNGKDTKLFQFHQVSVWAIVQNTLDFFESGVGLGRRITWGFEGNRLIVMPHAGYGENAYYDRESKSLQFYWFGEGDDRVYTCLSSDIVNHEFGHAVLDGLRPHFYETLMPEAAAFHEFFGDLTALLMAFSNNDFRRFVLKASGGKIEGAALLHGIGEEFAHVSQGAPYLRTARNDATMASLAGVTEPHALSQVMTGAMFDILLGVFARQRAPDPDKPEKRRTDPQALASTVPRMQTMAIQPLDLLPPCDVTFRDYALAILRSAQVANPTDPRGYHAMMLDVFTKRGILTKDESKALSKPARVFKRLPLDVFQPVDAVAASRGGAYRFLDDNRSKLLIPPNADVIVADVIRANKLDTDRRALPEQVILQYIWREDVLLEGDQFGRFAGERTSMMCGGTIVLDQNGNLIHWARKPGSVPASDNEKAAEEALAGQKRRDALLAALAARVEDGSIGESLGSEIGLVERTLAPFGVNRVGDELRFQLSPHFSIREADEDHTGDRQWQISF